MNRLQFLKSVMVAFVGVAVMPSSLLADPAPPSGKTRFLKIGVSLEALQTLTAYHGLDAKEELFNILDQELTRELGDTRGTLTMHRIINPHTFEPRVSFRFREDGKYGTDTLWGLGEILKQELKK